MKYLALVALFAAPAIAQDNAQDAQVSKPHHQVIAADKGKLIKFDADGKIAWQYDGLRQIHKVQQLENGNVLCQHGWQKIVEITPDKKIAWSYDATTNGNAGKKLEVHAFQRLDNGNTMIVENGIGRIIEVDKAGAIKHELKYKVKDLHAHSDVRMGHKLKNGHYLLSHEKEGRVTEYSADGKIVWDFPVPMFGKDNKGGHGPDSFGNKVYNAIRLKNGNTLIATGNGHSVLEVTPQKNVVWQVHQKDLPGITLAWVTSLEVLPNGNIIIGNCHAGPDNPQLIEVTRDKKVVWTFKDFKNLGNSVASSATVGVKGVHR
ncbi:arylsulfotransferase family protein [bacterium]|nr:arylsulfotransferase family protein [bacterium]